MAAFLPKMISEEVETALKDLEGLCCPTVLPVMMEMSCICAVQCGHL